MKTHPAWLTIRYFIYDYFICKITVSENAIKVNRHLKAWINPLGLYGDVII